MYQELVIGYDCREVWSPGNDSLPQSDKLHLLRPDIERALSIQKHIWNTVFVSEHSFSSNEQSGVASACNLTISREHEFWGFWNDLEKMCASLKENIREYKRPCWMISVSVVKTTKYDYWLSIATEEHVQVPQPIYTHPSEVDSKWTFLGYDVQDGYFAEGLGGVYSDEIQEFHRATWGKDLNKYHLFTDQERASTYSDWMEEAEHRPFFVFGLYMIDQLLEN